MKQLLFSIILLSLCGCTQFQDQKPTDLIPEDRMIQIMVDIHVADALVEQKYGPTNPNRPLTNALYTRIYKNYAISPDQFRTSYRYYESHPEAMDRMYTQIITELSKKEAILVKATKL